MKAESKPWPGLPWSWTDAAAKKEGQFTPSKSAIKTYERQLRSVAGQIRHMIETSSDDPAAMQKRLRRYAEVITPWAKQAAADMTRAVDRKNEQAWRALAGKMGEGMRTQLKTVISGSTLEETIRWNVDLIKDLPLGAADKIAELTSGAMVSGARDGEIAKKIMALGDISESRARAIARTEVSKASCALTHARASSVGSDGYIWRTARDGDVSDMCASMEGKFVKWSERPVFGNYAFHAGERPYCRCYPEPVIPQDIPGRTFASTLPTAEEERKDPQKGLLSHWEQNNKEIVQHKEGGTLPGVERATFDMRKATGYALNPEHPVGKHKAAVFKDILDIGPEHAEMLREQIMSKLPDLPALRKDSGGGAKGTDHDGERFSVYVPVTGPNGKTIDVLTTWIYDRDGRKQSTTPRMTNVFIDNKTLRKQKRSEEDA